MICDIQKCRTSELIKKLILHQSLSTLKSTTEKLGKELQSITHTRANKNSPIKSSYWDLTRGYVLLLQFVDFDSAVNSISNCLAFGVYQADAFESFFGSKLQ